MQPFTLIGVTAATAVILQLILLYFPGLNTAFAGLKTEVKQLLIAAGNLVVAGAWVGILAAGCFGLVAACPTVDKQSVFATLVQIGTLFLTTVGIQQGAFRLMGTPRDVAKAVQARDA